MIWLVMGLQIPNAKGPYLCPKSTNVSPQGFITGSNIKGSAQAVSTPR